MRPLNAGIVFQPGGVEQSIQQLVLSRYFLA